MSYVDDYVKRLNAIKSIQLSGMGPPPAPVDKAALANLILQKARSDFSIEGSSSPSKPKKGIGGRLKSVGLGILDIISRPNYAAAEYVDTLINEKNIPLSQIPFRQTEGLKGAWEGLSGKEKTSFIDVLQENRRQDIVNSPGYQNRRPGSPEAESYLESQMKMHKWDDVGFGLAGDLILDPLNVIGAGVIKAPFTAAKSALKGGKEAAELGDEAALLGREITSKDEPAGVLSPQAVGKSVDDAVISPETTEALTEARHANVMDVFNRDLRSKDYEKLQKSRVITDSAKIVDQVSKGKPSAVDFLTYKNILPLSPVARIPVVNVVEKTVKDIKNPAITSKTLFNASEQGALSAKLLGAARKQIADESTAYQLVPEEFNPTVYSRYIQMLKNAEESMIEHGDDVLMPRGGSKADSPYLRLSDVLETLPLEVAHKALLGTKSERISPTILLKAATGDKSALTQVSKKPYLFAAISNIDWTPFMARDYSERVIEATNKAHKATEDAAKFISIKTADETSDVDKAATIDQVVKTAKSEFKTEMPEAKAAFGEMLDGLRKAIPHPVPNIVNDIIEKHKLKLEAGVFGGKNAQHAAMAPRIAVSKEVTDDVLKTELGGEASTKLAAVDFNAADIAANGGIMSTVMSWVKPDFGYRELRPLLLENIGVRRASATTRARDIISIFSKIPESEHLDFWHEVRGFIPPVASHAEAVKQMQKMIHNMFGESGLAEKFAGNTSIARAGVNVEHLNKHLRIVGIKDWKFSTKTKNPVTGETLELEPHQVLDTWKNYQPKDSADLRVFAFNLTQAVENAMVEYSSFAQLGAIWGSKSARNGFTKVTGMHPAIEGMYFPSEIAPQIGKMAIGIDQFTEPLASSKFMKFYDSGLRTWKSGVTIYAPSHHIRNFIGDSFLMWMDGCNDPRYFTKAAQVQFSKHNQYSDIDPTKTPLRQLIGDQRKAELVEQIMGQSTKRLPKGTREIVTAKVGKKKYPITIDQIYQMAFQKGILPHSSVIEDLPGSETLAEQLANRYHPGKIGPFQPFKGKVAKQARQLSESREHNVRLAHFMYRVEHPEGNPSNIEEVFTNAANIVRKYHPDGLDLTETEKKVFRRLIPFYSWNRKAIPLIVEGLFAQPAKVLAYPKLMSGIQESQGIDSNTSDPWPEDQLFPDWLSGNVIGPVLPPTSSFAKAIARSDDEVGYTLINPGVPSTDIMEDFFNNPVKGIGNSVTPAIKLPAEVAFGREFQSGAPIDDKTEYVDKNVPLLSTLSRMTQGAVGTGLLEGGDLKGKETEATNWPAIINFLTAAGILDTGRYIKGGEFDLKERLAEERKNGNR